MRQSFFKTIDRKFEILLEKKGIEEGIEIFIKAAFVKSQYR